jgi:hypothetical protein
VALPSTQMLTGKVTGSISWGAGAWGYQSYDLHVSVVLKSGSLKLLEPSGPVLARTEIALPFTFTNITGIVGPRRAFAEYVKMTWCHNGTVSGWQTGDADRY